MTRRTTAVYLYCVVRAAKKPPLARVPAGLAGATPPAAHKLAASLWLVTADVPLDRYDPAELEPKLRDLEWVSEIAIAHESVIEHFSRRRGAVVVPTKLFTMFSSLDKALADVGAGRAAIERTMRRIAGSEEWGVRITRRPAAPAAPAEAARPASGAAFLTAKKQARDSVAAHRAATLAAAETAFEGLGRHARDASKRPRRQEPGTNPPILEAAFLVPAAGRARFKAEAKRQAALCASAGADMTVTGPWPAYNFIGAEAGA
jgi:hypothetical protein